ncbi:hypothetical protein PBAL39_05961 [Pedobacter sp. BAL39]|nr:hypothetical protein PBAL39_05961 [Pedobacter sp. BAL39]
MLMGIRFENQFGELISENQALKMGKYYVVQDDGGEVKQIEEFYAGRPILLTYFNNSGETDEQLINRVFREGWQLTIVNSEIYAHDYLIRRRTHYSIHKTLLAKSHQFLDKYKNIIAYAWISDLVKGIPDHSMTKKFYYDPEINPNEYMFDCEYNEDGSLLELYYNSLHTNISGQDSEVYLNNPKGIATIRALTGISQGLAEYYMTADVIPRF